MNLYYKISGFAWWYININIAVTPCVYLNYRDAEVQVSRISTVAKRDYGSRENQYQATRFSTIAKWQSSLRVVR